MKQNRHEANSKTQSIEFTKRIKTESFKQFYISRPVQH